MFEAIYFAYLLHLDVWLYFLTYGQTELNYTVRYTLHIFDCGLFNKVKIVSLVFKRLRLSGLHFGYIEPEISDIIWLITSMFLNILILKIHFCWIRQHPGSPWQPWVPFNTVRTVFKLICCQNIFYYLLHDQHSGSPSECCIRSSFPVYVNISLVADSTTASDSCWVWIHWMIRTTTLYIHTKKKVHAMSGWSNVQRQT